MNRLYGLDALRGLAAVIVLTGHVRLQSGGDWFTGMYGLSVDFFLMLSGYVLARTYEARLRDGLGAVRFTISRYRRLFPMAALGAVLALLVAWLEVAPEGRLGLATWGGFITALLFLPYPAASMFPVNGPRWSLFAELLANLLHAAGLARMSVRQLAILVAAMMVALVFMAADLGDWPYPGRAHSFVPGLLRIMVSYCIGILLWRCVGERPVIRLRLGFLCLGMVGMIYLGGLINPVLFGPFFVLLVSPVLILGGATCRIGCKAERWCSAAGAMSYPVYAIHWPLVGLAVMAGLGGPAIEVLALGAIGMAMAIMVYRDRAVPVAAAPAQAA